MNNCCTFITLRSDFNRNSFLQVVLQNGQIFTIFFLQKFCFHFDAFLVCFFLWIQCPGKGCLIVIWLYAIFKTDTYIIKTSICCLQTVFDPMFIAVYNLFYTSLPVLSIGIFDQDW